MANCYKLISCHPSYYSNIGLVNHPDLDLIYDSDPAAIVGINGDATQGYTLEKYIRLYWASIGFDAEYVSGVDFNAYTLTTFVYNGVEYVSGLVQAGTIANPGPITQLQFLNDFAQSVGLDLNFVDDGSGNISVLLQDTDILDFHIATTGTDGGTTYGLHEYDYLGYVPSASYEFDGNSYSAPAPGFVEFIDAGCDSCDEVTTVQTLTECPNIDPFNASLVNEEGEITISEINECLGLNIEDATIYSSNTPGHNLVNFTDYIRIELTRGDGSLYIMSSVDGEDVDEVITAPASNPSHYHPYYFLDTDVDGIYTATLEVYPTWDAAVAYTTDELTVVYYQGTLYQLLQNSTGEDPALTPSSWQVYEATEEEALLTRYVTQQKIVVLCISINGCEERLIHAAFCLVDSDFCNDDVLCTNPSFLKANKYLIVKKALEISVNKSAWNEVERQMNLLKTICNC